MRRNQKEIVVSELETVFSESGVVVVAQYAGLTVAEMADLRLKMGKEGGNYRLPYPF